MDFLEALGRLLITGVGGQGDVGSFVGQISAVPDRGITLGSQIGNNSLRSNYGGLGSGYKLLGLL
jgi:hypothetical protein